MVSHRSQIYLELKAAKDVLRTVLVPRKATWEGSISRTDLLNQSGKELTMAVVILPLLGSRVNTPETIREFTSSTAMDSG